MEVDKSYNGTDRTPVCQMPPASSDPYQHPASQHPDATSSGREPMLATPPRPPGPAAASLARDVTPPRIPLAVAESPDAHISDSPGVPSSAPHRLSPAPRQEAQLARPAQPSPALSPSAPPASPLKSPASFTSTPASLEPAAHQSKPPAPPPAIPAFCSPALVPTPSSAATNQTMSHGINRLLMASATPDDRPGTPNLGNKFSSAAAAPALMSVSGPSTLTCAALVAAAGETPCDPATPKQSQMYSPPAVESHLSTVSPASVPPVAEHSPPLAAHGSPTARPLPTLPLQTTQASWTAPVSSPPALVPVPPAASATSGEVPLDSAPPPPPRLPLPDALMMSSSKWQERARTEDGNGIREDDEQRAQRDSDKSNTWQTTDTDTPRPLSELPVHRFRTPVPLDGTSERNPSDSEKRHVQSGVVCGSDDSTLDHTPLRRPLHQHTAGSATEARSWNDSSQFSEHSALTTPSRTDVSSGFEQSSLADDRSSFAEASSDFDSSVAPSQDPSRFDSTAFAEESTRSAFETTGGSVSFADDSRDDTVNSARREETTESEELDDSSLMRDESVLETSLNDTSRMDEPSVDLSDLSQSHPRTGIILTC